VANSNKQIAVGSKQQARLISQPPLRVAIAWGYFTEDVARDALESMNVLGGRIVGLVRR
jgi:hypothetical protein